MGLCSFLCRSTAVLVAVLAVAIGVMMSGVPTKLGAWKWIDNKVDAEGHLRLRGIIPAAHHGTPFEFEIDDIPDGGLKGRVVVVTGANVGLGYGSSLLMAGKGAHVVMACRTPAKCNAAADAIRADIKGKAGAGTVKTLRLDLGSFASVALFAKAFLEKHQKLHGLMLNAGVMQTPFGLTKDGIEQQIGINHFGHFYLTQLLLPTLRATATPELPSTVTSVSSAAHYGSYAHGVSTTLADLNDESKYERRAGYGQSKMANVFFAQELAEREKGNNILANSVHPGAVKTELSRYIVQAVQGKLGKLATGILNDYIFEPLSVALLWDPVTAALSQVYTCVGPRLLKEKVTGKYFHPVARINEPHHNTKKLSMQKDLWKLSEELVAKFEKKNNL